MKKRIVILILLIDCCLLSYSQENEKRIQTKSSSQVYEYVDSANFELKKNPQQSFEYAEKALKTSIKNKDKRGEGLSYNLLGEINSNFQQYDLAINYYKKALVIFRSLDDKTNEYYTNWTIANAFLKNNDLDNSSLYYNKYLDFALKRNIPDEIINCRYKLSEIYSAQGSYNKALAELDKIIAIEKGRNNKSGIIDAENAIGNIYYTADKQIQAKGAYMRSAKLAEEIDDKKALATSLENQGNVLRKEKKLDEEMEVRQQVLSINKDFADADIQSGDNLLIADIYLKQNQADKAIPYIEQSIKYADKSGNLERRGKALQQLSSAYSKKQDYGKALEIYKKYVETVDDINKKRETEILTSLDLTTSLNRKLERLDLVEKELELSERTVDLLQQEHFVSNRELKVHKVLTYSLLSALMLVTFASMLFFRSSIQKRKANQLLALKSLRSQMNPHFIYNSLNSVNNFISRNDEKSANKYLSEFSKLMRSVMENSKHDFIPVKSEIEIIKLYLNLEHSRFADKFDYNLDIDKELNNDTYFLPPMLIQPFIENAIWHGLRYKEEKGFLFVEIKKNNNLINIKIEDDGIGREKSKEIKTKHQKEHVSTGLQNIKNRTGIINELFQLKVNVKIEDLDPSAQTGTRVTISLPLKNAEVHDEDI